MTSYLTYIDKVINLYLFDTVVDMLTYSYYYFSIYGVFVLKNILFILESIFYFRKFLN